MRWIVCVLIPVVLLYLVGAITAWDFAWWQYLSELHAFLRLYITVFSLAFVCGTAAFLHIVLPEVE